MLYNLVNITNNKIEALFSFLDSRFWYFILICFFFMVGIMFLATPFDMVLREDAYFYLKKGFEITKGDWTPIRTHFIGWSVFTALFLKLFGLQSIFQGMLLAKGISIVVTGASTFPFAYLTRKLLDKKASIVSVIAFTCSPLLIKTGGDAKSEPLFLLLIICLLCFLTARNRLYMSLTFATVMAGLSYWVRPNGLFMMFVIFIYAVSQVCKKKISWHILLAVPLVFFLISAPHLYQRYNRFGSCFDYGENSKYFVDHYEQVWSENIPVPSLSNYLATHGVRDYFSKFIHHGLFKALRTFKVVLGIWALLFFLGSLHYLLIKRPLKFDILFIFLFICFSGLVPVFHIFGVPRHLYILLPAAYIIAISFLIELMNGSRKNNILIASFLLFIIAHTQVPIYNLKGNPKISPPEVRDAWVSWVHDNLNGCMAIIEGLDLIGMTLPDAEFDSERNPMSMRSEKADICLFRPGYFNSLEDALPYFRGKQVNYLLLDRQNIERRPYLKEVYKPEWASRFILIKSFRNQSNEKWELNDMDIFKVKLP